MIAGTLEIQMLANLARLANDMSEAKSTVERSMRGIESAVASAKAALGALGIGLGVHYFVSLIKGTIDLLDHLQNLRKSTDITVEDLAGLDLAARKSGGNLESVAESVNKLSVNIGKEPERFRALGISAKDPLEAFKQLADIYKAIEDPTTRNAVAAAALGKAWAGAAPLLAEGGKRIGEMIEEGKRLAGITQENAEKARIFNDQYAELTTTLGATRMKVIGDALPSMNEISRAMQEAAKEGGLLLTVWVGLGGALAYLLGQTEAQQTAKRLAEINEQLAIANKQLEAGSLNPKGASSSFWSFLIPDVKLKDEAVAKLRETVAALEAEKAKLSPSKTAASSALKDGADEAAIAAIIAENRAKRFLKDKEIYEAQVAAVKAFGVRYAAAIATQSQLADLAFKEGGINNQRTQESLLLQQGALQDKKLRSQLEEYTKLRDLAKGRGEAGAADVARNAELITQTNAAIVANEAITQARIRALRTETAQQQVDQYNAVIAGHEAQGLAIADSLRDATDRENDEYQKRLSNLEVYLASAQGQIADDAQLREALEVQHQQNLLQIEFNKHQSERSMQIATWQLAAELMQSLAGKSKLAALAAIVISKGLAIAQVIQQTAIATMAAFAPPPIGLGPLAGAGLAASIQTLGAVQIGLIAATGLVQASQVGGGGASIGSPANPVNVTGGGGSPISTFPTDNGPSLPQTVVNVNVTGVVTPDVVDEMIDKLKDAINNKDATIIGPNSRQAEVLST